LVRISKYYVMRSKYYVRRTNNYAPPT